MEYICKRFEELSLEELYQIIGARQEVFVVEQNIIYQDLDFLDQNSTHLFFRENGRLTSYLRIIDSGIKYSETSIGRVLTIKGYRGRGLSRQLMEKAIVRVRNEKKMPIKIEAQEYLVKFYLSLGLEITSPPFILEGISHIEMLLKE